VKIKTPLSIIAGAVTLVGLVVVLASTGEGLSSSDRMIVVTLIMNAVLSLLGLLKTESTQHELRNGLIPAKVQEGITQMAEDPEQPSVTINSDDNV
jgi:hypothetical protein